MNIWDTPERRALAESMSAFVRNEVAPHLDDWEEAGQVPRWLHRKAAEAGLLGVGFAEEVGGQGGDRSEEHTSELQSRGHLVCRLLLEKKNSSWQTLARIMTEKTS